MSKYTFRIWRGDSSSGEFVTYRTEVDEGMVVLDVLHRIQSEQAGDMALRWNCKAGKCGSCGMEVNGKPRLACMTRMNTYSDQEVITVQPMRTFPVIKDLVCDVSWNYEQNKKINPFRPSPAQSDGRYIMSQEDVDRVQEFRKCIECYLCQDVCHVLRDHKRQDVFVGPRFMIRAAGLEMHPLDTEDRIGMIRDELGSGYCNITRCCTDVCPENITITDNGIIPLKERVADRYYDPVIWLTTKISNAIKTTLKN
ncbi:MAG TPA: succinate dehydrogenase/fumarate reductase iron-sulfur subunit [Chloroflexi bacterium]|nr:succinate dehydrogenase/fumarate reductase iron-sulfur subunit [Chloroflexota bacterium]|tara:strand:- start:2136 stop:2897 length:762 start_codon:yes stop_codon:yes gene_type:complete